jgi:hypothetical protein
MHCRNFVPLLASMFLAGACTPSKPDCKGTAQVCAGSCVELKSDNLNCGTCGAACGTGQVCSNGACTVTCAAGLVNCLGHCIDPSTERAHCGASGACAGGTAGAACADGQLCSAGQCAQTCSDAQAACPVASPTYCADLTRDTNNCGACGATCPSGQQCTTAAGSTACACPDSTPDACGTGTGSFCTSKQADPQNCGACGTICAAGQVCSAGSCVQTCSAAETTACPAVNPTYCASTSNDANNCGGCGNVCSSGQQCSGGVCSCPATTPDACTTGGGAGFCTNRQTDPLNCGVCRTTCAAGSACSNGTCVTSCPAGELACGGKCVDAMSDPIYCGAASDCTGGAVCGTSQACYHGACADVCVWQQVYAHPLTSLPTGATPNNGAAGGQGAQAIYGRTCWLMTSDWAWLVFPIVFGSGDDVFAIEADVYFPTPILTAYRQGGGIFAFNTATPGSGFGTHGISASVSFNSGAPTTLDWWASPRAAGSLDRSTTLSYGFASWHRLRLEGRRSNCAFRAYLDGALADSWTGTCDTTGVNLSLTGGLSACWSNLAMYRGLGSCQP